MKKSNFCDCAVVFFGLLLYSAFNPIKASDFKRIQYPDTPVRAHVEYIHGVKVSDPFRWLEISDSSETLGWIKQQNSLTESYLGTISTRSLIKDRLSTLWDYDHYGVPTKHGDRYFYFKQSGLENQPKLYVTDDLSKPGRILLDPNVLSPDGTIAIASLDVDQNGRFIVYGLSDGGSDWRTLHVREVASGKDLDDVVRWVKFSSPSWDGGAQGFYYGRFSAPQKDKLLQGENYGQELYYHQLGTPQSQDVLIFSNPEDREWGFDPHVTQDGRFLVITIGKGTERNNRVYVKDLVKAGGKIIRLLDDADAEYEFIGQLNGNFLFRTNQGASRYRMISVNIDNAEKKQWKEIVPEQDSTLVGVTFVNDQLIANYLHNAYSKIEIYSLSGKKIRNIDLPGIGNANGFDGKRKHTKTFFSFSSFYQPKTIYQYDLVTGEFELFKQPKMKFDSQQFKTEQIFYHSKDGTRVPMFVSYKKGLKKNGKNPVYLYGYGGFNVPLTPRFKISNLVWMEMGGVIAQPNLRGGGEFGNEWHDGGRLANKQNVFDDFIAAAHWLIKNKYTQSKKIAIGGGSNGGLLVGACLIQQPQLFGAALPSVGVLDMLRFHKFTIGWAWVSDYGSPENSDDFKTLYAYSPYHNVKKGTHYPATLITTGDHDDRVVPAHSYKFAAALQRAQGGQNPILIRIETRAGHGAGKPTQYVIEEVADRWAFLVKNLEMQNVGERLAVLQE